MLGSLLAGALSGVAPGGVTEAWAQGPFTGKPRYTIEARRGGTSLGLISVELFPAIAPRHAHNWDSLVVAHFYDSTAFHRVIPGFVVQGGDPNSRRGPRSTWGYGQPNQPKVRAEFSAVSHERGILSAARDANPNSADSQFFICVAAARSLNRQYSAYGRVTGGMAVVDQIVTAPRDANDNPLQKVEMFITRTGSNDTLARVPQLLSPAQNSGGAPERPVLRWHRTPDAQLYYVQASTDSTFAAGAMLLVDTTLAAALDSAFTLRVQPPVTQIFWRVRANNGGSVSAWGGLWRFRTGVAAPALLAPANNSVAGPATPLLEWAPVPGATTYHVQVARTGIFQPAQIIFNQPGVAAAQWLVPAGLNVNQRYFWRVRAVVGTETGFFSSAWNFRPSFMVGVAAARANSLVLAPVVPQPVGPNGARLTFTLPTAGAVSLTVFDVLGRPVARPLVAAWRPAGEQQAVLLPGTLAAGTYLVRLDAAGAHRTQRLVVE